MEFRDELSDYEVIDAIIPSYSKSGNNSCTIIRADGTTKIFTVSTRSFIRRVLSTFWIDILAQRKWIDDQFGLKNLTPIIINKNTVLVPVKIRKSYGTKDGCYGYVKLASIKDYDDDQLCLHSGTKISYISSPATLKKRIQMAKILLITYRDEGRGPYTELGY